MPKKVKLQASYDEMFHYDWHEPQFSQPNWGSSWLKPLQQCQHCGSFDIDFYDEDGPREFISARDSLQCSERVVHKYGYWPTLIPALH
jgi:hypothetical protein